MANEPIEMDASVLGDVPSPHDGSATPTLPKLARRGSVLAMEYTDSGLRQTRVPWNQRRIETAPATTCSFTIPHALLHNFEWGVRTALCAILPSVILAFHGSTTDRFKLKNMLATFAISVVAPTVGQTIVALCACLKTFAVVLVLGELVLWMNPERHWLAWGAVYLVGTSGISVYCTGLTTKLSLFLFTITMITHYTDPDNTDYLFPLEMLRDCLMGCVFGLAAGFFPFPRFESNLCETHLRRVFMCLSVCFQGLIQSVWVDSNTTRMCNLVRIRAMRQTIADEFDELDKSINVLQNETFPQYIVARTLSRRILARRLLVIVDGMTSFVAAIETDPKKFDSCCMFQRWNESFTPDLLEFGDSIDDFLRRMGKDDLKDSDVLLAVAAKAKLEEAFKLSSEFASAEVDGAVDDEITTFPWVSWGWFVMQLVSLSNTITEYRDPVTEPNAKWVFLREALFYPVSVFKFAWAWTRQIVDGDLHARIHLREALKTSAAMTAAVALLIELNSADPAAGGAVIGFVAEVDAATTVATGIDFLVGTVVGSVAGYLANSVSRNLTENFVWTCLIAAGTGFIRSTQRYGRVGFFMQLFALLSLVPDYSSDQLLTSMKNNVAAISWFFLVTIVVFPEQPSRKLRMCMTQNLQLIVDTFDRTLRPLLRTSADEVIVDTTMDDLSNISTSIDEQRVHLRAAAYEPSISDFPTATYERILLKESHMISLLRSLHDAIQVAYLSAELNDVKELKEIVAHDYRAILAATRLLFGLFIDALLDPHKSYTTRLVSAFDYLKEVIARLEHNFMASFLVFVGKETTDIGAYGIPALQAMCHCSHALRHNAASLQMAIIEVRRRAFLHKSYELARQRGEILLS